jgi:hypothetical protein
MKNSERTAWKQGRNDLLPLDTAAISIPAGATEAPVRLKERGHPLLGVPSPLETVRGRQGRERAE